MTWLRFPKQRENSSKDRLATGDEIRMVIDAEHDNLYWIALLITGDAARANKCLIDATGLSAMSGGVFYDWLTRWARSATARVAVKSVQDLLVATSKKYEAHACKHSNHAILSENEVAFLRQLNPQQVITDLDPFSRAILVMRGVQGFSISDCSLSLEVPRRCVLGAYCRALRWVREEGHTSIPLSNSTDPLLEILDGEE